MQYPIFLSLSFSFIFVNTITSQQNSTYDLSTLVEQKSKAKPIEAALIFNREYEIVFGNKDYKYNYIPFEETRCAGLNVMQDSYATLLRYSLERLEMRRQDLLKLSSIENKQNSIDRLSHIYKTMAAFFNERTDAFLAPFNHSITITIPIRQILFCVMCADSYYIELDKPYSEKGIRFNFNNITSSTRIDKIYFTFRGKEIVICCPHISKLLQKYPGKHRLETRQAIA